MDGQLTWAIPQFDLSGCKKANVGFKQKLLSLQYSLQCCQRLEITCRSSKPPRINTVSDRASLISSPTLNDYISYIHTLMPHIFISLFLLHNIKTSYIKLTGDSCVKRSFHMIKV